MGQNRHRTTIGIYVHIPFCERKCFYCDFYSIEDQSQRGEFVRSLIHEIELFGRDSRRLPVDTIFFGGGTPSLLTPSELERIVEVLHENFIISADTEFTMECNPGAIDIKHLADYRRLGANRLSFGVQSFFADELKFLQRIQGTRDIVTAFEGARSAGFENLNLDLIYALPDQSEERLRINLHEALSLAPQHISAYSLIVEPGTRLFTAVAKGEVKASGESVEASMYQIVMDEMAENGYGHYEVSNYARMGRECRHNLKYWNSEEYIGFGPSAHSHLANSRWWNVSSLSGYIASLANGELPVTTKENLTQTQIIDEYIFLQLRQGKLDRSQLEEKFGIALEKEFVSDLSTAGYWTVSGGTLLLTPRGFSVCDKIAEDVLGSHAMSTRTSLPR